MTLEISGRLVLFDLDNTLLGGDSDHAWGEFLIARKLVDESKHRAQNDYFYAQYKQENLDIHAYVKFTLAAILDFTMDDLNQLHDAFMQEAVAPLMLNKAISLVDQHKAAGDYCVIITATNEFITAPIADKFQVDQLLATELERENGHFTGNISGTPCYQFGKVKKLEQWLDSRNDTLSFADSIFYSDSINDLPLLRKVTTPVAVDPDEKLREIALHAGWQIISLRE